MKRKKCLAAALGLLAVFALWTVLLCFADVQAIGPQGSSVGLAGVNRFVHRLTGVHFGLYIITDWLGFVPVAVCMGFGVLGMVQWVKRKSIRKVDMSILVLGGFYLVVMAAYLLFEKVVVNCRPVLIGGVLEASYPSSTTVLAMCVMLTARIQAKMRIESKKLRSAVSAVIIGFSAFMVIGRLLSGVHWFTDIVGGVFLSGCLVMLYAAVCGQKGELE